MDWQSGTGVQLRIKAVALDGERALARDEALERNGLHALIQLLKRPRREARQQDHDPLAHAQPDIRARQLGRAAREKHAAILDAHILHAHSPQLVAHEALKAVTGTARPLSNVPLRILPPKFERLFLIIFMFYYNR